MAVQETTQQTILPQWYTDYAKTLMSSSLGAMRQPYATYGLPRIAGFSQEQEQAFDMAPERAASYQPYMAQALSSAQGSNRAWTDPGTADSYMNPYTDQVVSGIGDLAARNLREKLLPEVNRSFVGTGTFGGSRSREFTERAVRDAGEAALRQQTDALRQGYNEGAGIFDRDMSRRLQTGQQFAALGAGAQEMGLREAAALESIGAQRQGLAQRSADLAYADFEEQRDYPWTQLQRAASVTGVPSAVGQTTVSQTPGPSKTSQILGALGTGVGILGATKAFGSSGWLSSLFAEGGPVKRSLPPMKAGIG